MSGALILNIMSFLAIATTVISFTSQAVKVYRTKSAKSVLSLYSRYVMLDKLYDVQYFNTRSDSYGV